MVAATPPPRVTMPEDQLTLVLPVDLAGAAFLAAVMLIRRFDSSHVITNKMYMHFDVPSTDRIHPCATFESPVIWLARIVTHGISSWVGGEAYCRHRCRPVSEDSEPIDLGGVMRRVQVRAGHIGYRNQLDRMRRFLARVEGTHANDASGCASAARGCARCSVGRSGCVVKSVTWRHDLARHCMTGRKVTGGQGRNRRTKTSC